ncbi:hypothetical protein PAESOLCIP111_00444 [Paenibacillus solanacearum]|uniref:Uncharacterized protein n=1 Tax=Paenibacillus solanacearum TaxID=2048548 RepID=A0A916NM42_9BACL|nr:hypothetical protein [Paenibacillus solanacearum]CAG7600992.1 hypothetical protein PAESOLCIP111_00444 [Paenibacillus solanacearum]
MKLNDKLCIQFTNINITSLASNSGVFTGDNAQSNWQVNRKSNCGFGTIAGYHNSAAYNVNVINDNDMLDSDFSSQQGNSNEPVTQQ